MRVPIPNQGTVRGIPFIRRNFSSWPRVLLHLPRDQAREGVTLMNWDRVEGNWKEFKGKVQQKWGKLTNDDLDMVQGKRVELAGRLQQRYGYVKDQAEREIDTWLKEAA
jgi:uncharacterized protein YjbJ (UPF0337 family)